jgi:hypothetical protein
MVKLIVLLLYSNAIFASAIVDGPRTDPKQLMFLEKYENENLDEYDSEGHKLDKTHDYIEEKLYTLANRLDSFFGQTRADDELNNSRLRVSNTTSFREAGKRDNQIQFGLNLKIPQLQEKFQINLLKTKEEIEEEKKEKERKKQKAEEEKRRLEEYYKQFPELRPKKKKKIDPLTLWRFNADTGINVTLPLPVIFERNRLRKNFKTKKLVFRFVEELGWYTNRSWQQETSLDIDRPLNDEWLFRWINQQNWNFKPSGFRFNQGPSLIHPITKHDAISYNARAFYIYDENVFLSNYQVSIKLRRSLHSNWFFIELTPGLDFPKLEAFKRQPFIFIKFETLFGKT